MSKKEVNNAFLKASQDENLELMKYLLTSPDLKYNANIHEANDFALNLLVKMEILK